MFQQHAIKYALFIMGIAAELIMYAIVLEMMAAIMGNNFAELPIFDRTNGGTLNATHMFTTLMGPLIALGLLFLPAKIRSGLFGHAGGGAGQISSVPGISA